MKISRTKVLEFSRYSQSTVRSTCTFIGSTLMILDTSHLYLALLSWALAMIDNTLSEKLPSVRYTVLTCSLFLYQTICAGGFPPRDRQVSSNCCPRFTVSPSVYPSMYGMPGGSGKLFDHASLDLDRTVGEGGREGDTSTGIFVVLVKWKKFFDRSCPGSGVTGQRPRRVKLTHNDGFDRRPTGSVRSLVYRGIIVIIASIIPL